MNAIRFTFRGVVQGVGFRPFIYRTAVSSGLRGFVTNTRGSVLVHVEGEPEAIARFRERFRRDIPPAARVARVAEKRVRPTGIEGFAIRESEQAGTALSTIPPDLALCGACRSELDDPGDRRFGYPFINCTNCGPRFTIVRKLPYDREHTSMSVFLQCAKCSWEYADPRDRRFHAEPNACPSCGPALSLLSREGKRRSAPDPVGETARALKAGEIVALRGLGGFHLAADATDDGAVRRLRERKHREEKPFAVMVGDIETARSLARVKPADEAILGSPSAPVLLLRKRDGSPLAPSVAPGLRHVGLFLPYTPLHRLILDRTGRPLVMTSGNLTDEPIATGNAEALERLSGIADRFLVHDREIVQRSDDSVVRRIGARIYPVRRARGFVPAPVLLRTKYADVAGLGGELKATFCIVKENFAYLSQHLGDLDQPTARDFYAETFGFFREFLDADLKAVCRDLHPAYFTTSFAESVPAGRLLSLQHHKAHLYALLAETGYRGKAIGVSFDGTGYGEDGTVWGGEFFEIDGMEMRRAAALDPFPLQGGDSAIREPWKAAVGYLHATFGAEEAARVARSLFADIDPARIGILLDAISKKVNVLPSSSCGRLFDAAAALAGVCRRASYEGQAPMLLEGSVLQGKGTGVYNFRIRNGDGLRWIDWRELVAGIAADAGAAVPAPVIARRFHDTMAEIVLRVSAMLSEGAGAGHVLLSGGVFQNVFLLRRLLAGFRKRKLKVLIHREVPANDGGISLGQAYYAANTIAGG